MPATTSGSKIGALISRIRSDTQSIETLSAFALAALVTIAITVFRVLDLDATSAFNGYVPTVLMKDLWSRPDFAHDYPSGENELLRSLALQFYPLAGRLGLSPGFAFAIGIAGEVVALLLGAFTAVRLLLPRAGLTAAILAGVLLVAGSIANCDIARWGHPYYGSVYNYANGTGLAAVSMLLAGRYRGAGLWLGLTLAIHPILGLLFGYFGAVALLADWRKLDIRGAGTAAVIAVAIGGGWLVLNLRGTLVADGAVPADLYISLTRMLGFHWFPLHLGMFTTRHHLAFLPLASFCVLLVVYLSEPGLVPQALRRPLAGGFTGLVVLTAVGVSVSAAVPSITLVKLALHRASALIPLIGVLVVVPGLWRDLAAGHWLRALLAMSLLLWPFVSPVGLPLAWVLAMAAVVLLGRERTGEARTRSVAVGIAGAGCLAILAFEWSIGELMSWRLPAYSGADAVQPLSIWLLAGIIVAGIVAVVWRIKVLALAIIAFAALAWTPNVRPIRVPAELAQARDFLAVQRWAREATPPGTIFMLDPAHAYGWREHSERPSFGTLREWLYAGWIYNTRRATLEDGLKRLATLGLDYRHYLALERQRPELGHATLHGDVRKHYYAKDEAWFRTTAKSNGIGFFVFDKAHMKAPIPIAVAFENASYVVGKAGQ